MRNWTLMTGSDDQVLELAALLGVKYKRISDLDYSHSNIITVLNREGEIRHQQTGLGVEPDEALLAIDELF